MAKNKHREPQPNNPDIIGRISGADPAMEANDQTSRADISYIDQQEGNMNNGTCGGNFESFDPISRDPSDDLTRSRG